ncbi:MAG: homoserine dehydrogenase, partial [Candidatus Aerophobetes bacterium]|nr:homoserine dehydrogenase [Candidatus Aerophobetes bacterium]
MKVKLIICGFGKVGQAFAELLGNKKDKLKKQFNLEVCGVCVIDLFGAATIQEKDECIPLRSLLSFVQQDRRVEQFPSFGKEGFKGEQAILKTEADVLVETTPTNIITGEPGLTHIRAALKRGMNVISANKGPLVLKFGELNSLAKKQGVELRFGAATAAALPTVDLGHYCLAGAEIIQIEGILNGTTNYI